MTIFAFISRFAVKKGYSTSQFVVDVMFLNGLFFVVAFIFEQNYGKPYSLFEIVFINILMILAFAYMWTQTMAYAYGKAGLSQAIIQTSCSI